MKNKFIVLGLIATLTMFSLTGCVKNNGTQGEPKKEYVVSNDYVDVTKYKGLETPEYVSSISEEEVDNYIQYIMNYTASNDKDNPLEPGVILDPNELTDEMVKVISNNDYSTVAEYRVYIKGVIEEQSALYFEEETKDTLFNNIVNESKLKTYDDSRLNEYVVQADEYYKDFAEYLGTSFEDFYTDQLNCDTQEDYDMFLREQSLENLKKEYIIKAISSAEKIEISEEEIDAQIEQYIKDGYFTESSEVTDFISREEIATNLKYQQVLDLIYTSANFVKSNENQTSGVRQKVSSDGGVITYVTK